MTPAQNPADNSFLERLPKAAPDGIVVAILLSFLTTAGLFYVNLGGAFLSAFVDGLGLSREAAGYITSANKYGAAFGALMATFGARYLPWRKTAYVVLLLLITVDFISFSITNADSLIVIRFIHGSIGGFLIGIGFSVIARTASPDKVFGMLLAVQYSFGSLGIWLVPGFVAQFGPAAVFSALIAFSTVTFFMVSFIPNYADRKVATGDGSAFSLKAVVVPVVLTLLAIFLFQAANMGFADYAFELGKESGFSLNEVSNLLAAANVIGVAGGVLVYVIGTRWGRVLPITIGLLIAASATYAFHWSKTDNVYFIANAITGITWGFVIPYLFGICSTFDSRGQIAALSGFMSKMGLASGPLVAALVIGQGNFDLIINLSVFGLILCLISALPPAIKLDNLSKKALDSAEPATC